MHIRFAARPRRRGFTLIELLIVIVVIGILVGLLSLAVGQALSKAKVTRIKVELDQLSTATESFKNEYGAYPPSFFVIGSGDEGAVDIDANTLINRFVRHINRMFPRYVPQNPAPVTIITEIANATKPSPNEAGANLGALGPAEAIVFFLGGLPIRRQGASGEVTFELTGFSADPQNPFQHIDVQPQRTPPLFEFDTRRLVDRDNDKWPEYVPPGTATVGEMPPYVYFDAASYNAFPFYRNPNGNPLIGGDDYCVPYAKRVDKDANGNNPRIQWVNPKTFQIISAGLDGVYGRSVVDTGKTGNAPYYDIVIFPEGVGYARGGNYSEPMPTKSAGYTEFDNDNLTNFTEGPLEDAKP